MSRRKAGATALIPIAAVLLWALHACSDDGQACAAGTPTPDLRTAPWPTTSTRTSYAPPHAWPSRTARGPLNPSTEHPSTQEPCDG